MSEAVVWVKRSPQAPNATPSKLSRIMLAPATTAPANTEPQDMRL